MTDDQLQLVLCTIQQLLVEHALYLHGPMSLSHIQAAEEHLQYQLPSHIPINHVDFLGFNVQELHCNLLKFHYHKNDGILYSKEGFSNYARVFLTKLEHPILPLVPAPMLPWMRWMRHVLGNVVNIIGTCSQYLVKYLIEDKNRVAFLAFEFVLRHLDALTLPVVDNWDKALLLELRLIFITYHTNISYSTGIRTIFLSDQQLSTFAFDRPPDSLQTPDQDSHKGASTSSSSSSPSSSSRTTSQTVPHEEYLRQFQMMRTEIETLKAALLQKDNISSSSLDTNSNSLYIQEALQSSLTTQDVQQWNQRVCKRQCAPILPTPYISRVKEPGYNYSAEFNRDLAANVRASIARYHAERLLLISRAEDSPLQCPHVAGGRLPKLNFENIGYNITEYTHAFRLPHATFLTNDLQQICHLLQNGSYETLPTSSIFQSKLLHDIPIDQSPQFVPPAFTSIGEDVMRHPLIQRRQHYDHQLLHHAPLTRYEQHVLDMERVDTTEENLYALSYHGLPRPMNNDPDNNHIIDDVSDDAKKANLRVPQPSSQVLESRAEVLARTELQSTESRYAHLADSPPPLTPTPTVLVSYRPTDPAPIANTADTAVPSDVQVPSSVTTVVHTPIIDPYQLTLEQRLLEAETEIRTLRAAASLTSASTQPLNQEIIMEEISIPIAYPADKVTAFAHNLKQDSQ
jgi:hypothetical protein